MTTDETHIENEKRKEIILAARNSIKLATSLIITLGIAFAVRFWIPKFFGPEAFGKLNFADRLTFAIFCFATLGAESYIEKRVAVRAEHASEFMGAFLLFRLVVFFVLILTTGIILTLMGKDDQVYSLVFLFAAGQIFFVTNATFTSLLQAHGTVNEVAFWRTVSKMIWGGGIVAGALLRHRVEVVAVAFLVSEFIKVPMLLAACRKHLELKLVLNWTAARAMIWASFPFFINSLSHTIYSSVDVVMISGLTTDEEVGWYGAATNLNGVVLLLMPVVNAVVMPMTSRIAQLGEAALGETMRSAVRLMLMATVPMALLVAINAEYLVAFLFGDEYVPTVASLRIISPIVPLTFLCVLLSIHLIQMEKIWTLVKITLTGLLLNPALNALLILPAYSHFGNGGAGMAAGMATTVTEITITILLFRAIGKSSFDLQTLKLILRFGLICAILIALFVLMEDWGIWRAFIIVLLYVVIAIPLGALPIKLFIERVRQFLG
jgi:O-antigen/teichoic acid export membrane protein